MKANEEMDHHPSRPADMQEDFFNKGRYEGTEKSNLGQGHTNLSHDIINGCMMEASRILTVLVIGAGVSIRP